MAFLKWQNSDESVFAAKLRRTALIAEIKHYFYVQLKLQLRLLNNVIFCTGLKCKKEVESNTKTVYYCIPPKFANELQSFKLRRM